MRYFGVRAKSPAVEKRPSSTARALLSDSPIPSDMRNGIADSVRFHPRPISRCEET